MEYVSAIHKARIQRILQAVCVKKTQTFLHFLIFHIYFWSKSCLQCSFAVKSMDLPKCKSLVGSKYSTRYFGRSAGPIQSQEIRRSFGASLFLSSLSNPVNPNLDQ